MPPRFAATTSQIQELGAAWVVLRVYVSKTGSLFCFLVSPPFFPPCKSWWGLHRHEHARGDPALPEVRQRAGGDNRLRGVVPPTRHKPTPPPIRRACLCRHVRILNQNSISLSLIENKMKIKRSFPKLGNWVHSPHLPPPHLRLELVRLAPVSLFRPTCQDYIPLTFHIRITSATSPDIRNVSLTGYRSL